MQTKNQLLLLIFVLVLVSCADTYQLIRQGNNADARLSASDSLYIGVSRDGVYGRQTYTGSGMAASRILLASFAKRVNRVETASAYQSYEDALKATREKGFKYLVYPTILHWEDRASEWSAIPDRVELKIQIFEAMTNDIVYSVVIEGKSGLATFGGDHPQDLLPKPVDEFVSALF